MFYPQLIPAGRCVYLVVLLAYCFVVGCKCQSTSEQMSGTNSELEVFPKIPTKPIQTAYHVPVLHNEFVYLIGGNHIIKHNPNDTVSAEPDILILNTTKPLNFLLTQFKPKSSSLKGHTAHKLSDDKILVLFGHDELKWPLLQLYDPETNTWEPFETTNTPEPRYAHSSAITSTKDRVLVYGGLDSKESLLPPMIHILDVKAKTWSSVPASTKDVPTTRVWSNAVILGDDELFVSCFGHGSGVVPVPNDECAVFSITSNTFIKMPMISPPPARHLSTLTTINKTHAILFGGTNPAVSKEFNDAYFLTVAAGSLMWTRASSDDKTPSPRYAHGGIMISETQLLVFGGQTGRDSFVDSSIYTYDVVTQKWESNFQGREALSTIAIVSIIIGGLTFLGLVVLAVLMLLRARRTRRQIHRQFKMHPKAKLMKQTQKQRQKMNKKRFRSNNGSPPPDLFISTHFNDHSETPPQSARSCTSNVDQSGRLYGLLNLPTELARNLTILAPRARLATQDRGKGETTECEEADETEYGEGDIEAQYTNYEDEDEYDHEYEDEGDVGADEEADGCTLVDHQDLSESNNLDYQESNEQNEYQHDNNAATTQTMQSNRSQNNSTISSSSTNLYPLKRLPSDELDRHYLALSRHTHSKSRCKFPLPSSSEGSTSSENSVLLEIYASLPRDINGTESVKSNSSSVGSRISVLSTASKSDDEFHATSGTAYNRSSRLDNNNHRNFSNHNRSSSQSYHNRSFSQSCLGRVKQTHHHRSQSHM